jgi:hypothetical protein
LESKQYEIFRKYFHVPTAWKNHDAFQQLIEHRYPWGVLRCATAARARMWACVSHAQQLGQQQR